ncbi:hypothetical protein WG68_11190 [Arsukibacterium ikkense]|uniref:HTH LytTR-type domain-containing protein n=1 Tax=Arsukibacterium ikkense TaxID=336831 RepID=A0A0M2V3S1_9GAMM|nr:LytTR family DNA-binding domain-containing protein [Arsukibacterium ikkense]KKO45281.1 hypothetical protein WG68_11190 [Arsukibacterium ikkense]
MQNRLRIFTRVTSIVVALLISVFALFSSLAIASTTLLPQQPVTVCDVAIQPDWPVNFSAAGCQQMPLSRVNPQGKVIWLRLSLHLNQQTLAQLEPPLALYLNAKASSSTYLNGYHLGNNGLPGNPSDEVAGDMDARFYVPLELLQIGDNQLAIKMSAQQGVLTLPGPIHFIGLGHYNAPQHYLQRYSNGMLVLLGILLTATLYFAVRSLQPLQRVRHVLLVLMSLFAALQLFSEISRGLFTYSYPLHDLRLLIITAMSLAFGLCLLIFIALRFASRYALHWIYAGAIVTLLTVLLISGFDSKTTAATFCPVLISAVLTFLHWYRTKAFQSAATSAALVLFLVVMVLTAAYFHETWYFVLITLLLSFLFAQQAWDFNLQLSSRQLDQEKIAKLMLRLEQDRQHTKPTILKIAGVGKVDIINTVQISFCQAAGDYSEINLTDGRQHLYSGTLKTLESELPSTFLRVHRSYLVNLEQVKRLTTSTDKRSGSAASLLLTNGQQIPVSRRLIPSVRNAVTAEPG